MILLCVSFALQGELRVSPDQENIDFMEPSRTEDITHRQHDEQREQVYRRLV